MVPEKVWASPVWPSWPTKASVPEIAAPWLLLMSMNQWGVPG